MAFDIDRIQKSARRVRKFLQANSKRPGANAVHDLRTSTRALETAFTTVGLDSKKHVKRLLHGLRDVCKRAGKVRDMDVLTAALLTIKDIKKEERRDAEQDCLVLLLERLGAKRNTQARKLRHTVETTGPQLQRDLLKASKALEKLFKQAAEVVPITMAKTHELSSGLQSPARLNRGNLHAYRLRVKELRDVLQLSDDAGHRQLVEILTEVKDAIGEWHDWEELAAIAGRWLHHDGCSLIEQLQRTADSKYEHALSLTGLLRGLHELRPESA